MDCSLPGSSVHGIYQARVLEWGAIAFSVSGGPVVKNPAGNARFDPSLGGSHRLGATTTQPELQSLRATTTETACLNY